MHIRVTCPAFCCIMLVADSVYTSDDCLWSKPKWWRKNVNVDSKYSSLLDFFNTLVIFCQWICTFSGHLLTDNRSEPRCYAFMYTARDISLISPSRGLVSAAVMNTSKLLNIKTYITKYSKIVNKNNYSAFWHSITIEVENAKEVALSSAVTRWT